ncbi:MAG: hypothetical protein L0216_08205 [Planctomycetales bacterium]|nr:hypothetical protein [Planctomycetales bacterium]
MTTFVRAEVLRLLRARGPTAVAILGTAGLCLFLVLAWPTGATAPDERAALSATFFGQVLLAQVVAVGVLGPLLAAGSLAGERERRTLDLLRAAPVRPGTIVLAKWAAAAFLLALLVAIGLPAWGACLLLGAVRPEQLAGASFLVLGEILASAAVGTLASAAAQRVLPAALLGLALGAPLLALAAFAAPAASSATGAPLELGASAAVCGLLAAVLVVGLAARAFGRGAEGAPAGPARFRARPWARETAGEPPRRRVRSALAARVPNPSRWPDGGNSYFLRELSGALTGLGGIALPWAFVAGLIGVPALGALGRLPGSLAMAAALATAAAAAIALPLERERRTLDLLRMVPGSERAIPRGKALAALALGACLAGAFFLGALPSLVLPAIGIPGWRTLAAFLALGWEVLLAAACLLLGLGIGTLAGALAGTGGRALLGAAGGVLLVAGGPPLAAALLPFLAPTLAAGLPPFLLLLSPWAAASGAGLGGRGVEGPDGFLLAASALLLSAVGILTLYPGLWIARARLARG